MVRYLKDFDDIVKPIKFGASFTSNNPFASSSSSSEINPALVNAIAKGYRNTYLPYENKRSLIDRAFDAISLPLYTTAGIVRGFVSDEINPLEGFISGIKASNPFGAGYEKGEHTYSKVLEDAGWRPTSTSGKIARGLVGFVGDVLLDPLTYMSGGISAVVRGTGKAGVKLTHSAEKLSKEFGINISEGLTKADAEKIIKSKNLNLSDEALSKEADKLVKSYNEMLGIRPEYKDVEFRLGNAPFGRKIFGDYADVGFTISDGRKASEFGDKTLAPIYAKIRDSIYGSKLGELFSTKSSLYKLSKTDPVAFYDLLHFVDTTRGLTSNKLLLMKKIRDKAKEIEGLNLTPAETKEIIELMENGSKWSVAREIFSYNDTQIGKRQIKNLQKKYDEGVIKLEELTRKKSMLEDLKSANEAKLIHNQEELQKLRDDYRKELASIQINDIGEINTLKNIVKLFNEELESLKSELSSFKKSDTSPSDEEMRNIIFAKYNDYLTKKNIEKGYRELQDSIGDKTKLFRSPDIQEAKVELVKSISRYLDNTDDFISPTTYDNKIDTILDMINKGLNKEAILQYIEKNKDFFDGRAPLKFSFIASHLGYGSGTKFPSWKEFYEDRMNALIAKHGDVLRRITNSNKIDKGKVDSDGVKDFFKRKSYLAYGISKGNIQNDLDKIIQKAKSENNPQLIEEFVNNKLGYPIDVKKFVQIKQNADGTSELIISNSLIRNVKDFVSDLELYAKLQQAKIERIRLLSKFDNAKTVSDVQKIIQQEQDAKLMRDYIDTLDDNIIMRQKALENESALVDESRRRDMRHIIPEDKTVYNTKLVASELGEIQEYLFKLIGKNGVTLDKIHPLQIKWVNNVTNEIQNLLNKTFKTDYTSLTDKQKDLLYKWAINNVNRVEETTVAPTKVVKKASEEYMRRLKTFKADYIAKHANKGRRVEVTIDGKTFDGVIDEVVEGKWDSLNTELQKPTYNIIDDNGNLIKGVKQDQLTGIYKPDNIDDIIKSSDVTKDTLNRIDELEELIRKAEKSIDDISASHKSARADLLKKFEEKAKVYRDNIVKAERAVQNYTNALRNKDFNNIESLARQLEKAHEALNNSDAFDTLMRSVLGDRHVDKAIQSLNPDVIGVVLKDDVDVSDKVRQIAQFLRNTFYEIGKSEVDIGKLNPEQFEAMLTEYLPHILTADGAKMFANQNIFKKIENFGAEFGYGRVFNPFAKSRKIKSIPDGKGGFIENPTVMQINDFFRSKLKGKNLFSENIADIYLARALKHNDLMYDNAYMRNMLDDFGKDLNPNLTADEGYDIVMNYGMLKQNIKDVTNFQIKINQYHSIKNELSRPEVIEAITQKTLLDVSNINTNIYDYHLAYKKAYSDNIAEHIDKYLKQMFPDKDSYTRYYESVLDEVISSAGVGRNLDDLVTPMVQLDANQTKALHYLYDDVSNKYLDVVREKLINYEKNKYYEEYKRTMSIDEINNIKRLSKDEIRERVSGYLEIVDEVDAVRLRRILKNLDDLDNFKPPQIKQVNKAIVQKANQARKIQIAKDQHRFLQLVDKFTHFIKLNQTTIIPAFHARNKLANTFNNWLIIGKDAVDPELQKNSFLTLYNKDDLSKIDNLTIDIIQDGKIINMKWSELYKIALDYDVIDEGFFAKDLGAGAKTTGFIPGLPAKFDPTDTENFILYKKGAEVGSLIEGQDRFLHFVSQVRRGMSFEDASASSRRALFDYSDLTAFEQNVMRRIIPFYTWLRKNSAFQLEMMLEQPKKYLYVSKVIGGIEGMVDEEDRIDREFVNDFAKDWVQTPFYVTNPDGRLEPVFWNPNLPFMDIGRIPNPFDLKGSMQELFTQMNPLIKTPIEQITNKNYFFDSPIVGKDDSQIGKRLDHVLSNLAMYNVLKGFGKKSDTDLALHGFNTTSGIKFLSYDYEKYKAMKLDEMREMLENESIAERAERLANRKLTPINVLKDISFNLLEGVQTSVSNAINYTENVITSSMPTRADEYEGALRPISQSKYEKLSDVEKQMYLPPTKEEAFAYHKKAIELEKQAFEQEGKVKKFIWTLCRELEVGERNKPFTIGEVSDVIDGDTFKVVIGDEEKTVRLLLIDTPESANTDDVMPFGSEASEFSKKYLIGKDTKLYFDKDVVDIYGRMLAYVEVDGEDFNEKLLKEGLGKMRYNYNPPYRRMSKYKKSEEEAYKEGKGIWSLEGYAERNIDRGYNMRSEAVERWLKNNR